MIGHGSYAGGHYEIIKKDKNSITYYPYSSNSSKFFGKIEKQLNRIVPIIVKMESLIDLKILSYHQYLV